MGNNLVETINYSDFAEYSNCTCIILNCEFEELPKKETGSIEQLSINSVWLECWLCFLVCFCAVIWFGYFLIPVFMLACPFQTFCVGYCPAAESRFITKDNFAHLFGTQSESKKLRASARQQGSALVHRSHHRMGQKCFVRTNIGWKLFFTWVIVFWVSSGGGC